ncbi:MAG TPA: MotA/TolQ/ExbB proton channel family protein [Elusimicrobiota bacterium]|nr:MotA/TolQ/ExbB proton channel family protein [Elusimicrobiota bacterium]
MDWMTPLGYLIGLGAVGYVLVRGQSVGLIFNLHAMILVYGGTIGATLLSYPENIIMQAIRSVRVFLFPGNRPGANPIIRELIRLSDKARRQGIESLEEDVRQDRIPLLTNGLRMVLDGLPMEIVRSNLIKEIRFARDRHAQIANVFRSMASYAPIFGLLGTLVGVVQVLVTLTDPKTIGASMAIAMTATFYGIFGANFIFLPIAGKLNVYAQEEVFLAELIIEGVLAIQQHEVPALVMRKLQSFAEAHKRDTVQARPAPPARRAA